MAAQSAVLRRIQEPKQGQINEQGKTAGEVPNWAFMAFIPVL